MNAKATNEQRIGCLILAIAINEKTTPRVAPATGCRCCEATRGTKAQNQYF
jgi:hypothetical protein